MARGAIRKRRAAVARPITEAHGEGQRLGAPGGRPATESRRKATPSRRSEAPATRGRPRHG
eukprot:7439959-Alexandrium_andersonii.AAC.1